MTASTSFVYGDDADDITWLLGIDPQIHHHNVAATVDAMPARNQVSRKNNDIAHGVNDDEDNHDDDYYGDDGAWALGIDPPIHHQSVATTTDSMPTRQQVSHHNNGDDGTCSLGIGELGIVSNSEPSPTVARQPPGLKSCAKGKKEEIKEDIEDKLNNEYKSFHNLLDLKLFNVRKIYDLKLINTHLLRFI